MHKELLQIIIQNSKKKNEGKPKYLIVGKLFNYGAFSQYNLKPFQNYGS